MTRHRPFAAILLTALIAVLVGLTALPQASQAGTETRDVAGFTAISLRGGATVRVRQGEPASVRVTADDALLPMLETVVDKERLEIRWKRGESGDSRMQRTGAVTVTVVTPRLTALSVAGSGDIEVAPFNTPKLDVSVAGSGSTRLDTLAGDELAVRVAGSGDVRASGQVARLAISIAGSGDVALAELKADDVSVRIAGSGDVQIHANKTLAIRIAGSGDIVYSGDAVVSRSIMGSGNVTKR